MPLEGSRLGQQFGGIGLEERERLLMFAVELFCILFFEFECDE
jgi:hypothetical protein